MPHADSQLRTLTCVETFLGVHTQRDVTPADASDESKGLTNGTELRAVECSEFVSPTDLQNVTGAACSNTTSHNVRTANTQSIRNYRSRSHVIASPPATHWTVAMAIDKSKGESLRIGTLLGTEGFARLFEENQYQGSQMSKQLAHSSRMTESGKMSSASYLNVRVHIDEYLRKNGSGSRVGIRSSGEKRGQRRQMSRSLGPMELKRHKSMSGLHARAQAEPFLLNCKHCYKAHFYKLQPPRFAQPITARL
ncbi:hypothetical protein J6590_069325 [Homalodisca vitripennis]|nr:hypothetical protein J6590_069325 [Homalodisca vitripennis]